MKVWTLFPCGNKAYRKKFNGNLMVMTMLNKAVTKRTMIKMMLLMMMMMLMMLMMMMDVNLA